MPQLKQPLSLRNMCLKVVATTVENASVAIGTGNNYRVNEDNPEVDRQIHQLREYFVYKLGHRFNDVCREIHKFSPDRLSALQFPTILAQFIFHSNAKIVPNLWCLEGIPKDSEAAFWDRKLSVLRNVTSLDISNISCSDQMLMTIGTNCQTLEVLKFSSKPIEVTKLGLEHVAEISSLLVAHDTYTYLKFSNQDVRTLLVNRPRLVGLNYEHMGSLICGTPYLQPLRLRYVAERNLKVKHVQAIANMCPDVERLLIGKSARNIENPLITLAKSDINVRRLQVIGPNGIHFNVMLPLLRAKGMNLTCLHIWRQDQWFIRDVQEVVLIGIACPFLEEFLFGMELDRVLDITVVPAKAYVMSESEEQEIFKHILKLKMVGRFDFNCGIVQTCLRNAKKVASVILKPHGDQGLNLRALFEKVVETNQLTELKHFILHGPQVHLENVDSVKGLLGLPKITYLRVSTILSARVIRFFRRMENVIRENNLNLRVTWVNLVNNGFSIFEEGSDFTDSADDMGGSDNEEDSEDDVVEEEEDSGNDGDEEEEDSENDDVEEEEDSENDGDEEEEDSENDDVEEDLTAPEEERETNLQRGVHAWLKCIVWVAVGSVCLSCILRYVLDKDEME